MQKHKKEAEIFLTLFILAASFFLGRFCAAWIALDNAPEPETQTGSSPASENGELLTEREEKVFGETKTDVSGSKKGMIVVDAGHGGIDAGKVGVNGALEKEVNLQIAGKLKTLLEEAGYTVTMTRKDDGGLYDEEEDNKKQQDMKRRCELINGSKALLAISIHQNSYTQDSVCGPQVFYYETSAEGKQLAQALQDALNEELQIIRPRDIKANATYYILRKTSIPTVIVECGFLSNQEEAQRLTDETYQETVARAILEGMEAYLQKL